MHCVNYGIIFYSYKNQKKSWEIIARKEVFFFFYLNKKKFYLQCCVHFCQQQCKSAIIIHTSPPSLAALHPTPIPSLQAIPICREGDADVENGLVNTAGEGEGETNGEGSIKTHTHTHTHNQV